MLKKIRALSFGIILASSTSLAFAATPVNLTVNSGWAAFNVPGPAGTAWDKIFNFSLIGPATLSVTDIFLSGDRFEVFNFATSLGLTSVPTAVGAQIFVDFDTASTDPRWSSGKFQLNPGNYSINGILSSSPFQNSSGGVRVDTDPVAVPEPGTISLLLIALAGLGLRKKLKHS